MLAELAQVLEECKSLRDDLLSLMAGVVENVSKKVEKELIAIRAQQIENRKFIESKFTKLFKIFESQIVQKAEQ